MTPTGPGDGQQYSYKRNSASFMTIGASLVYFALAFTVGVVFLGVLPVILAYNAHKNREPLRPLAFVAGGASIVLSVMALVL